MTFEYIRDDVEFKANNLNLHGWLYRPKSKRQVPVIVMAHGYACVKELYLDKYAECFAAAGFAVLAYDHRNFGESECLVPQEIDPIAQINDWQDAITYVQTLPFVNPNKIGIWGTSLAGGHVIVLGALDKRVTCIVSQVPTISGLRNIQRRVPIDKLEQLYHAFTKERIARYQGQQPSMVPIMTDELMNTPYQDDKNDYRALLDKHQCPTSEHWRFKSVKNYITLLSLQNYMNYNPELYLKYISPTPVLMIVANHDTITMTADELDAYSNLNEPKLLKIINGGHFTGYHQAQEETKTAACQWFIQWLQ